ncbi:helix-turn-helix domain-containing protein [Nonomuraea sp. NPDC005650]|uniref:helix-turn-helix domain-containing protein n=1 Tax=Nonomuraea sp. NPDC005650 TaxID=3157045 RepID=UPI0033B7C9E6
MPPNGLLLVSPYVPHRMARPADTVWQFMFAALDAPLLLPEVPWRRLPVFVADAAPAVAPFETFLREVTTTGALRAFGLRAGAQHLLVEVARLLMPGGTTGRRAMHPAVDGVLRMLETHYTEPLPLSLLARHVGLSPSYLAELFTAQLGVSPARHQARLRIRRARTLLAETDRSGHPYSSQELRASYSCFSSRYCHRTGPALPSQEMVLDRFDKRPGAAEERAWRKSRSAISHAWPAYRNPRCRW